MKSSSHEEFYVNYWLKSAPSDGRRERNHFGVRHMVRQDSLLNKIFFNVQFFNWILEICIAIEGRGCSRLGENGWWTPVFSWVDPWFWGDTDGSAIGRQKDWATKRKDLANKCNICKYTALHSTRWTLSQGPMIINYPFFILSRFGLLAIVCVQIVCCITWVYGTMEVIIRAGGASPGPRCASWLLTDEVKTVW